MSQPTALKLKKELKKSSSPVKTRHLKKFFKTEKKGKRIFKKALCPNAQNRLKVCH